MDAAVITFDHIEGAEHAFASAEEFAPAASWLDNVAFVEMHHKGRIVVRGTVAGHYVDIDDERDPIGPDTGRGAAVGMLAGLALGPPGWAVGLVLGGVVGSFRLAKHIPRLVGPRFDEIRKDIPEQSSAVLAIADAREVDAMIAAFAETSGRLTRYHLAPAAYADLETAVAGFPPAAAPIDGARTDTHAKG